VHTLNSIFPNELPLHQHQKTFQQKKMTDETAPRKRGRPRKNAIAPSQQTQKTQSSSSERRGRGRPRRQTVVTPIRPQKPRVSRQKREGQKKDDSQKPRRGPGRPRKNPLPAPSRKEKEEQPSTLSSDDEDDDFLLGSSLFVEREVDDHSDVSIEAPSPSTIHTTTASTSALFVEKKPTAIEDSPTNKNHTNKKVESKEQGNSWHPVSRDISKDEDSPDSKKRRVTRRMSMSPTKTVKSKKEQLVETSDDSSSEEEEEPIKRGKKRKTAQKSEKSDKENNSTVMVFQHLRPEASKAIVQFMKLTKEKQDVIIKLVNQASL